MMPKADLHLHQEWSPRLDRIRARRTGLAPYDWAAWRRGPLADAPPGMARLQRMPQVAPAAAGADDDAVFAEGVADTLAESAAAGAVYAEVRFGAEAVLRPRFMELFRRAEERVRAEYPMFYAEAIASVALWHDGDRVSAVLDACAAAGREGMGGVDLLYVPYATEADWYLGRQAAARAAECGLGVTVHAGEFSTANIAAVAGIEGVTRVGHATQAFRDPWLVHVLAESGVTVEVCLTGNLLLGAVPRLAEHPMRRYLDAGIPIALGTDNPVRLGTSIADEYAAAAQLGLSEGELLALTRTAIDGGFTTPRRRAELRGWVDGAMAVAAVGCGTGG